MSPHDPAIGGALRDARHRRKIDLTQVEAETKIRLRYLRALENEEWDVLPGGAYNRAFIRTYADFLGLDGERLAEEYQRRLEDSEPDGGRAREAGLPQRPARGGEGAGLPRGAIAALISVALLAALIAIALLGGGNGSPDGTSPAPAPAPKQKSGGTGKPANRANPPARGISLRLAAQADVWVCLLGADGAKLVDGRVIGAGAEVGPFRSGSFTVAFGNGSIAMQIDGKQVPLEDTPNPVGYEVAPDGAVRPLPEARRPTCQ